MTRWAWADVDLGAIDHNVRWLCDVVAPAEVWVVVKADGYGHGALSVARTAVEAGATGLCVALVQEAVELRDRGIDAPILVLSEQPPAELSTLVEQRLRATVYSLEQVAALVEAGAHRLPVHLKVDTGMNRVGCDPAEAMAVAEAIVAAAPHLVFEGAFTHLAVADEPSDPFTAAQLVCFDEVLGGLEAAGHRPPIAHVSNSAGALAHPAARRSFVRVGIAAYGISPGHGVDHLVVPLRPAMSVHARVSWVKRVHAGERVSYGLRHTFERETTIATVPIGYADGVPRRLSSVGGEVLIGGRRCPIVGVVTMDQMMVDVGDAVVARGDHVVLIGTQGGESIPAMEWADKLGTIGYEVVCGISKRIERHYR